MILAEVTSGGLIVRTEMIKLVLSYIRNDLGGPGR